MIKVTTEHGTQYIIDYDNYCAKRVKGEDRNDMYGDGEWFTFQFVSSFDRETLERIDGGPQIGYSMYFQLSGPRDYDWRISTNITSIEEYDDSDSSS